MEIIKKTQSPQHFIDDLKCCILWDENLNETLDSLDNMTLLQLFWLYERILVRDMINNAREQDESMARKITEQR